MKTLQEMLGEKITEQQAKADAGGTQEWANLPLDREFRVKAIEASVGAIGSGAPKLDVTLSIVDPDGEWDGRRVWNSWFYSGQDFQLEQLAQMYVAFGLTAADIPATADYAEVYAAIAPKLIDRTALVALRNTYSNDGKAWAKVRWANPDTREPRLNIKPPKDAQRKPDLSVDVTQVIATRQQESAQQPFPETTATAAPPASGIRLPTGASLPRGS